MHFEPTNLLLLLLFVFFAAAVITSLFFPVYYRWSLGLGAGVFARRSFSILSIIDLAKKTGDMTESFKSFYEMKYQSAVFVIKGLGSTIVLFLSPFIEKVITKGEKLTNADCQLIVVTAIMILILGYLIVDLRKITTEYAETIRIYQSKKPDA